MVHLGRDSCSHLERGLAVVDDMWAHRSKTSTGAAGIVGATASIHLSVGRRKARYNIPSGTPFRPFNGPPSRASFRYPPPYYAVHRFFDATIIVRCRRRDRSTTTRGTFVKPRWRPYPCFDCSARLFFCLESLAILYEFHQFFRVHKVFDIFRILSINQLVCFQYCTVGDQIMIGKNYIFYVFESITKLRY